MPKEKGKSPTKINKELLGGKNTLPTKDGVNSETLKKTIETKKKEIDKPFTEKIGKKANQPTIKKQEFDKEAWEKNQQNKQKTIDKNIEKSSPTPKTSEPPKSKGWQGRGGRGGGYIPNPVQEMIDRKRILPNKPLSENKGNEKIENKEKFVLVMNDLESPIQKNQEVKIDDKEEFKETMKNLTKKKKPPFLLELEKEKEQEQPEINVSEPSLDGFDSDSE